MNFFILIQKHEMRQAHLFFFETNYQDKKTDLILKTRVKLLKKACTSLSYKILCNVIVLRDVIITISKGISRSVVVIYKDRPLCCRKI